MNPRSFGSAALVAALALALAPSAQAQDVPFGTLNSGSTAPMNLQAQNTVVRSQAELDATGLSQLMPRAALVNVDWDKEMLIALVMGPQSSGGYGISAEAIKWRITPFGGPGGPLGGARHLEVQVKKTAPAPGSFVTMAITNPFQLIKLDKTSAPIVFRDAPTAQRLSFKRVDYTESDQLSGSFAGSYETRTISLLDNGGVSVLRTHPVRRYAPITGQASAQELDALSAAVRRARAASIPGQLQIPIVPFQHSFTLDIAGSEPALTGKTSGMTDDYSGYDARLAPVVTIVEAIGKRVEDEFNRAQREVKGTLAVRGGAVYVVEQGGQEVEITPANEAAALRMFAGRVVRLEGQRSGSDAFVLSKVLSPRSTSVAGIAGVSGGRYVLDRSHLEIFPPLPAVKLAGHLSRLAWVARGKRLVVRGWLFDEDKQNPELIVSSVLANAKSARRLWPQGRVNAGDAVEVTYALYGWARVKADQGGASGWMPLRNLSIGEPLAPLHGPAGSTSGAAGAVTGSGN